MKKCKWHLCQHKTLNENLFCSSSCINKFTTQKYRIKLKLKAIKYKGSKCESCGYDKCVDAFDFHHRDPTKKDFGIGSGNSRSWKTIKPELDKCMLLCSNCHRTIHYNLKKTKYINEEVMYEMEHPTQILEKNTCIDCNTIIGATSKRCMSCHGLSKVKIAWPSDKKLASLVWEYPRTILAKELGVSGSAIGKRCRLRNITQPSRGYWSKIKNHN